MTERSCSYIQITPEKSTTDNNGVGCKFEVTDSRICHSNGFLRFLERYMVSIEARSVSPKRQTCMKVVEMMCQWLRLYKKGA